MPNVEWLLQEAMVERPVQIGERTVMDNEFWRATIERLEIGEGLRVFLTAADVHKDLTVEPRDSETVPWLASNVAVAGRVDIDLPDGRKTGAGPDRAILFRPSDRKVRVNITGGQRLQLTGVALRGDRLERIFDGAVPAVIRPLIERDVTASRVVEMRATKRLRTLADGLFAPGLNGPLRFLFIEGTVLQLLASMAAAAGQLPVAPGTALSPRERHAILEARERLLADMRTSPTLGELAASVGLSEKRLNLGFRAEFGTTVFNVLRNERLEHARVALEDASASLKQVAFRVGYNHVTNFINAFTARYGAPPRRYAEQQPDATDN
jgi:AraC-like DNA-binding protein